MKIELQSATKRFKKTTALDAVDFETRPGEIVSVLGLNGAGKSTLLRALAGLLRLDTGALLYDGEPFDRSRMEMRRGVLFVPDTPVLHPQFSLLRNVGIYLRQYERHEQPDLADTVAGLFEQFDLADSAHQLPHEVSRGERYKAGLVALIAVAPSVWLLDEPFASGMDARGIARFREAAEAARDRGATIVYTTQLLELAEGFCDRIFVLAEGVGHTFDSAEALRASDLPDLKDLTS